MAKEQNIDIDSEIEGQVSLMKDEKDGGFKIGVTLVVNTKGLDRDQAQKLVEAAHEFCPYSKATRGNVDVKLELK